MEIWRKAEDHEAYVEISSEDRIKFVFNRKYRAPRIRNYREKRTAEQKLLDYLGKRGWITRDGLGYKTRVRGEEFEKIMNRLIDIRLVDKAVAPWNTKPVEWYRKRTAEDLAQGNAFVLPPPPAFDITNEIKC